MKEPFSWQKFFSGVSSVVGWAKFASFWLKLVMILAPVLTCAFIYHSIYSKGFQKGLEKGRADVRAEWMKFEAEHPRQTITGSTVNNNVLEQNKHFQFGIFPLRLGWCA